jgi:hypothetical protein
MIKKFLFLIMLFSLNNCAPAVTSFLGPIITGIKTGSVAQTSLSFGSNKMFSRINKSIRDHEDTKNKETFIQFNYSQNK